MQRVQYNTHWDHFLFAVDLVFSPPFQVFSCPRRPFLCSSCGLPLCSCVTAFLPFSQVLPPVRSPKSCLHTEMRKLPLQLFGYERNPNKSWRFVDPWYKEPSRHDPAMRGCLQDRNESRQVQDRCAALQHLPRALARCRSFVEDLASRTLPSPYFQRLNSDTEAR